VNQTEKERQAVGGYGLKSRSTSEEGCWMKLN
jgi:hypothetical protein